MYLIVGLIVFMNGSGSYQKFELGVGAQKNEENVIKETFPKVD